MRQRAWTADGGCTLGATFLKGSVMLLLGWLLAGVALPAVLPGEGAWSPIALAQATASVLLTPAPPAEAAPDVDVADYPKLSDGLGEPLRFGLHVSDGPQRFGWQTLLAARLGADVVPLEFRWDVVEPQASRFEWTAFDEAVAAARRAGVRLVGVLHYPAQLPPLSRSVRIGWPSAHVDDWDFFVRRVVTRYRGDIEDWIVVRGRTGSRDPVLAAAEAEFDAQLAQLTAQAVRAAGGARVLAAAPGADWLWLAVFATRGGLAAVDGLALDINRWPAAPEGLPVVVGDVRYLAAQLGIDPELWVWQFGYPTHRGVSDTDPHRPGVDLDQQAAYLVRSHVLLASAGVSTVLWHELADAGASATDAAANFGLYEGIGRGKPAAFAYRAMLEMLAGLSYVPPAETEAVIAQFNGTGPSTFIVDLGAMGAAGDEPGLQAHLFASPERAVVVLWTSSYPGEGQALLRALDGLPVRAYDLHGRPIESVAVSSAPIYIELLPGW